MAQARPLALRREIAAPKIRARKFANIAEVLIDTDVYHLVDPFSYGIPDELLELTSEGSWVRVPFNNEMVDGLVVEIKTGSDLSVKPIATLLNYQPFSKTFRECIAQIADRYGTRIADILRFAPQIPKIEALEDPTSIGNGKIQYFRTTGNCYEVALANLDPKGRTLILVPTEREANHLAQIAREQQLPIILHHSGMSTRERKQARGQMALDADSVVIGTRGSVFLPLIFKEIRFLNEISPHYWEPKQPRWNSRDIALLRARNEGSNLRFIGYLPSLEISRLIESGYVTLQSEERNTRERRFFFAPESFHASIRYGLQNGKVLVVVVDKTYSSSFICKKCRNIPRCDCGGRLALQAATEVRCLLCANVSTSWRCLECSGDSIYMIRKGAMRIEEELGKAFPRVPIYLATKGPDAPTPSDGSITIATPGMEPLGVAFKSVVLLDGEALLQRYGLRSEEVVLEYWSRLVSASAPDAGIYISLPRSHRVSQSLQSGRVDRFIRTELQERSELNLPPYRRLIRISGPESELVTLRDELKSELPDLRTSTVSNGQLVIRVGLAESAETLRSLFALQRYRSATRRRLFTIDVDPFDI